MPSYEIISEKTEVLGEGPTWDSKLKRLYWIDIKGMKYSFLDDGGNHKKTIKTSGMISSIVPSKSGKMYATMGHGYYRIDINNGTEELLGEVEREFPNNRFNDGKVDPFGNYWAGTMDMQEKNPTGNLYVMTYDGQIKKVLTGFTISNGLAWDTEKLKFYHIDTPTKKVMCYDYDEKLSLKNPKVAVNMGNEVGFPDGMNIDCDGNIWVASWAGNHISRWNPDTGKKLETISLPATNITSCVFGGRDSKTLYVSSAKLTDTQERNDADMGGSIFKINTEVNGTETYQYKD